MYNCIFTGIRIFNKKMFNPKTIPVAFCLRRSIYPEIKTFSFCFASKDHPLATASPLHTENMATKRSVQLLKAYRPFFRILAINNSENFQTLNWKARTRAVCYRHFGTVSIKISIYMWLLNHYLYYLVLFKWRVSMLHWQSRIRKPAKLLIFCKKSLKNVS